VIRYLIVLECFLIALLISPWFGSAVPDNSPPNEQVADQRVTHAPGIQSPEERASGGMGRDPLSAADRVTLARELLGSPDDGSSAAQGGTSRGHDARRPSSIDPATVVSDSAALAAAEPPAQTNGSSPGQATRGAEEASPGLSPASVAAAQRHLSRLGYSPGAVDGVLGERTRRALADYRRRTGAADGLLSETLIARLRRDADRAAARDSQRRRVASYLPRDERAPGWMASIAGGFQRLLGHEFDSKKQPGRIREYCLRNQETWIFDEGREAFTYCGHLAAAH
jgi:Putative peptidoglycan binding domain